MDSGLSAIDSRARPPQRQINVLVVDDSPVAQMLLVHILKRDSRLCLQGTANSGYEALSYLRSSRPDVILMDVYMPGMDGLETTRRIMESHPAPIVICSASFSPAEVADTFRALEAGAVAVAAKPVGFDHPDFEAMAAKLVETVLLMSEVKVVRRWRRPRPNSKPNLSLSNGLPVAFNPTTRTKAAKAKVRMVAIGASTGGPPVLQTILAGLPRDFSVPVLIVQHIAAGFVMGLAEWLEQTTGFPVHIAAHGEEPLPGHAYLAPDGCHMGLGSFGAIALSLKEPDAGLRPSVSHLFRSIAAVCGASAAAVLLTGMGRDGAEELQMLREVGAVTIAQNAESSAVHGMPGSAIKLGAATHILAPDEIAPFLTSFAAGYPLPYSAAREANPADGF